jgi:hypothetical protein
MPSYRLHATCTPLNMWGPTLPRHFGVSRIVESTTPSPLLLKTPNVESPMLRIRATCLCSDRRSRLNRGIALRDFDVHGILALTNPDSPICEDQGFFRCLRVNHLAPPPDPTIHGASRVHPTVSNRRFSSSTERSLLRHLCPVRPPLGRFLGVTQELSFLSFVLRLLQRTFTNSAHPSSSNTLQVLKFFWALCTRACNVSTLSFSGLLLRLNFDLHSPARLE